MGGMGGGMMGGMMMQQPQATSGGNVNSLDALYGNRPQMMGRSSSAPMAMTGGGGMAMGGGMGGGMMAMGGMGGGMMGGMVGGMGMAQQRQPQAAAPQPKKDVDPFASLGFM